jgi:hypothetical protein
MRVSGGSTVIITQGTLTIFFYLTDLLSISSIPQQPYRKRKIVARNAKSESKEEGTGKREADSNPSYHRMIPKY